MTRDHASRAAAFRRLHRQDHPLVLVNPWDAGSARWIEHAGAPAIAGTSAGVSWSRGRADGHGLSRAEAMDALRSIIAAVEVPVTWDIEGGYGARTPEDVALTVSETLDIGAVGINLEDAPGAGGEPLLTPEAQAIRIRAARGAARERGRDLFINARIDVYLTGAGAPEDRLDLTVHRAEAYLEAGADGIFVPGLSDLRTLETLAHRVEAPVNVMVGPGSPAVSELTDAGVRRISVGPAAILGAYGFLRQLTQELLRDGTYGKLADAAAPGYGDVDGLFRRSITPHDASPV